MTRLTDLKILYRGPLSSCNYGCPYCPFAKHRETLAEHRADDAALTRFVEWVQAQTDYRIGVLFTPWGEALLHGRYQRAFIALSNTAHVQRVAIQTNLAVRLDFTEKCDKSKIALWCTYHPGEVDRAAFVAKCAELDARGVRYSVGVVGLKEHADEIDALRAALPAHVYLWVNAYKRIPDYYSPAEIERISAVDPLFPFNNVRHPSRGKACRAGESVISVSGDGTMRRCHFVKQPIGNIYDADWATALRPRNCVAETCGCHIGYVHMPELGLYDVFGENVLERIPARRVW